MSILITKVKTITSFICADGESTTPVVDDSPTPSTTTPVVDDSPTLSTTTPGVDYSPTPSTTTAGVDYSPMPSSTTPVVDDSPTPSSTTPAVDDSTTPSTAENPRRSQRTKTPISYATGDSDQDLSHSPHTPSNKKSPYYRKLNSLKQTYGDIGVETYKGLMADKSKTWRSNLTDDQRKTVNEKARIRQRKYRKRKKEKEAALSNTVKTRKEKEKEKKDLAAKRIYWREQKRKQREKKKDNPKRRRKSINHNHDDPPDDPPDSCPIYSSKAKSVALNRIEKHLPKDAQKWVAVMAQLLSKATPTKRKQLQSQCLLSTPSTAKRYKACEDVVTNIAKEVDELKYDRNKESRAKRNLLSNLITITVGPKEAVEEALPPIETAEEEFPPIETAEEEFPPIVTAEEAFPPLETAEEEFPSVVTAGVAFPPIETAEELSPQMETTEDTGPLGEVAEDPSPRREAADKPSPPGEAADEPSPSIEATEETGPLREVAEEPSPPGEAANKPSPPGEAADKPSPPGEAADKPSPPGEAADTPSPSMEATEETGPLREVAEEPSPPGEAADKPSPSMEATEETGPPGEVAEEPSPPGEAADTPSPPGEAADTPSPPGEAADTPSPPGEAADTPSPPGEAADTPPGEAADTPSPPGEAADKPSPPGEAAEEPSTSMEATEETGPLREVAEEQSPPGEAADKPSPPGEAADKPSPPRESAEEPNPQGLIHGKRKRKRNNPALKSIIKFKSEYVQSLSEHRRRNIKQRGLPYKVIASVTEFYEREDHIINLPLTRCVPKKYKKPLCYLKYTTKQLYKLFTASHGSVLKLSKFQALRPSHVKLRNQTPLMQCVCITCENISLQLESLRGMIRNSKLSNIHVWNKSSLCDPGSMEGFPDIQCVNRKCTRCGVKGLSNELKMQDPEKLTASIECKQWQYVDVEDTKGKKGPKEDKKGVGKNKKNEDENKKKGDKKNGDKKGVGKNKKKVKKNEDDNKEEGDEKNENRKKKAKKLAPVTKLSTVGERIDDLIEKSKELALHLFIASWQHNQYVAKKHALKTGEILMTSDYAENIRNDGQRQPSSVHWHYKQVSLHPVVCDYLCPSPHCGKIATTSFIVISDDLVHDGFAVSSFEQAVLQQLSAIIDVEKVTKFSDNCAVQYKSKLPFYLLTLDSESESVEVERHYFGPSHGKSRCDGETGVVKKMILEGVKSRLLEINCARDVVDYLQTTITCEDGEHVHFSRKILLINNVERKLIDNLQGVQGTRTSFCVKPIRAGQLRTRFLSCFCRNDICENEHIVGAWLEHSLTVADVENPQEETREEYFRRIQKELGNEKNFPQFLKLAQTYQKKIKQFGYILPSSLATKKFISKPVDPSALSLVPHGTNLIPTAIQGDGNCLPRCGSLALFGNEDQHAEVRVRITLEMATNLDLYVKDSFLKKGSKASSDLKNIAAVYAQFIEDDVDYEDVERLLRYLIISTFMMIYFLDRQYAEF
jgi:hypothetical protein